MIVKWRKDEDTKEESVRQIYLLEKLSGVPVEEFGVEKLSEECWEMWITFQLAGETMTATAQTVEFPSNKDIDDMTMKIAIGAKHALPLEDTKSRMWLLNSLGNK